MNDTAMGAALRKAGVPVDRDRLFSEGSDIARRFGTTPIAVRMFSKLLTNDRALLDQMALEYLEARVKDMKNLPEGGHLSPDAHSPVAPDRQSQNGKGQGTGESLRDFAQTDSRGRATQVVKPIFGLARPRTAAEIAGAAHAAKTIARMTVLDTAQLAGQIVGDIYWSSLRRINRTSAYETALTQLMLNHCVVTDESAKVRDVLKPEQFQLMQQKAKEIADGI